MMISKILYLFNLNLLLLTWLINVMCHLTLVVMLQIKSLFKFSYDEEL